MSLSLEAPFIFGDKNKKHEIPQLKCMVLSTIHEEIVIPENRFYPPKCFILWSTIAMMMTTRCPLLESQMVNEEFRLLSNGRPMENKAGEGETDIRMNMIMWN